MMDDILCAGMPQKVAVAWSGGADSTALFWSLFDLGFDVQLWHVDHGWHEDSVKIATALAEQAHEWGVGFYSLRIEKPHSNIESESRKGRYHAFEVLAKQTGCFDVALGHHADDQAETVCMRLLQGAGVAGCQGMRRYRQQGSMHFWRPFLHVSRHDIEESLVKKKMGWLDDPSNTDTQLWRNKIRCKLFPEMASYGVDVQLLFLRWQQQAQRVQLQITKLAEHVDIKKWHEDDVGVCEMRWEQWCELAEPVRVYTLQKMIGILFADGSVFGRRHILAIEQWRKHGGHGWLNLSGCCLYRDGQGLQLCQGKVSLRAGS